MITEDYVSFETAKQLKKKGFDVPCEYFYVDGKLVKSHGFDCNWNEGESLFTDYKNECSAPTLQMAMKWLRDMHDITIGITFSCDLISYEIQKNGEFITSIGSSRTYEQMVNEAIQLCVKTLI